MPFLARRQAGSGYPVHIPSHNLTYALPLVTFITIQLTYIFLTHYHPSVPDLYFTSPIRTTEGHHCFVRHFTESDQAPLEALDTNVTA